MNEIETRFYLQEINLCLKCIYNSQDIYKRQRLQKFKETGYLQNIYQNELDKACFEHEMAYGDFKDLDRRTASDKILRDKAINIGKNRKNDGYLRDCASMVYKCFDKKLLAVVLKMKIFQAKS